MSKQREPLFITHKRYNELQEKYNASEKSLEEEKEKNKSLGEMNALLLGQTEQLQADVKSMTANYNNLVEQQLSTLLNILTEDNAETIYELLSPIDYDGRCLWDTCYEILGTEPSRIFDAEDNLGWFENMSYHSLVKWNEIGRFHNIEWKQSGSYELYDSSTFDETRRKEYDEYRLKLYYGTISKIVNDFSKIHRLYSQESEYGEIKVTSSEFYGNINSICRKIPSIYAQMNGLVKMSETDSDMSKSENIVSEDDEEAEM